MFYRTLVGDVFEARVVVGLALFTRVSDLITFILLVYKDCSCGIYASKVG